MELIEKLQSILSFSIIETDKINISLWSLLLTFIILVVTGLVLKLIKKGLMRYSQRSTIDSGSVLSIYQIIKYIIWVIAIGIALDSLGFKLNLLLASSAALLVGLGLGIQQIFNDYVSGLLILFEQNIKVGDVMEVENQMVGKVIRIGLRTSKLKTRDDIIVVIPNSKLVSENTINWSDVAGRTRFHVNVGVAYGSDTRLVEKVLLHCANQVTAISADPKPFVRFSDFGDSSLDFQLYFWVNDPFYVENTKSNLRFAIDDEFRKNQIQIPFPQRDVHIIPPSTNP